MDTEAEPCSFTDLCEALIEDWKGDGRTSEAEFLTKQELLSVLAKFFRSKDFVVEGYSFNEYPTPNLVCSKDEYLKLEVAVNNAGQSKQHSFFVKKRKFTRPNCYEKAVKLKAFYKETELYSTVFLDFADAQSEHLKPWCPKYYFSKPGELLVLEDLLEQEYFRVKRRECLSHEQLLAAMRSLASFHAASIEFEKLVNDGKLKPRAPHFQKTDNVTVADVYPHLNFEREMAKLKCHPGNGFFEAGIKSLVNLIDLLPGYSRAEMEHIKRQLPELLRDMLAKTMPSSKYRNVFIHGDLCSSNIFFRHENSNLEAILIDFQTCHYAPPALDLVMLFYLNQSRAFRMKEMQGMMQAYYNMFSEELAKNDICIRSVLPVSDFLECCNDYADWAALFTVFYFQTYLLSEEVIVKYLSEPESYNKNMIVDRTEMVSECFSKDATYRTRMTEMMNEVIKQCIVFP